MDKYGLLESSQGSSGCRKRFLPTNHPSEEASKYVLWGESGGGSPLGLQGTWVGSPDPRQLQGKVSPWMTVWER